MMGESICKTGMELWEKQKEAARISKIEEQKQMKEMLDKYWPWGKTQDAKPRGLRNLRLEELFPIKDYENAKRFVGTLDLGRPGGGAPLISGGRKITRTKEDPLLRFQFGSKDLRRCVDNTFRYKKNKEEQEIYKKELDNMVEEKKRRKQLEKESDQNMERQEFYKPSPWGWKGPGGAPWRPPNTIGFNFLKSMGWSDEKTLKKLENQVEKYKDQNKKTYDNFNRMKISPPNRITKLEPLENSRRQFIPVGKHRKLSPLSNGNDNGVELVTLLAKDRKTPQRVPLCSTDVTADKYKDNLWSKSGSAYLKELTRQVVSKQAKVQEMKQDEIESARRHFTTWDTFWGRPGNGAPRSALKKQRLDRLLYPQMVPIGVH